MRLSKIQLWRHVPNTRTPASFLSHFSTKPEINTSSPLPEIPGAEAAQNSDIEIITITDATHWSRRIHKLCIVDRDADAALRLLHQFCLRGFRPDSLNISSILHALCDANRFAEAHHRFLLFISSHCAPDERTCNVLIARLLDGRDPYCTLRLINTLVAEKPEFVPSLVNYNRLVDGFCKLGRLEAAHLMLYHMMMRGHCPNVVSYTTLINGYCRIGDVVAAEKVFDEMSEYGVRSNAFTHSTLFCGFLRKREFENGKKFMRKVWEAMGREEDVQVNSGAFCTVIDSLCREGLFHEVFKIAEDMPQGKNVLEEFAYGQMIDSLCRFERAYQLLEEGMQFGYSPSEFTYTVLIEGLCHEYDLAKAKEVLNVMLSMEDEVTYSTIIHGLLNSGKAEEAVYFLRNVMPEKGFSPGVVTYNAVLRGLFKLGLANEAMEVFNNMVCSGVPADCITYTAVIEGLCESKCIDDAKKFWNNVVWPTGVHDNFVYAALLKGLCHLDKFNEACNLLYELADCGVTLNSVNYNIVLDYACKLGLKREAYQIVGEMRKNGVEPDAVTWRILDKLHHNLGQLECGGSTAQSVGLKVV
ncbi:Pentatricopeptide repeat-containing protein [Sesamum angolense]|uniref:Pentatricopeptide repeat-containing protein n=1 Tax=Sesamum angolense TaxID=2727404 RepID=A0AAE1W6P5_9LAMI|nr:Pentatricopeptide repeat-containing protein [Sesamum angolense]